ncbi:YlxR family protein [Curtobacterium sp. MCLR17_007]|uniref:YlxR family protein n=1 Tax=unclassified Curtobacterium TaxID=257496 RepID=UPI0009E870FC|nr:MULTISPECIES: YlxR family protein [unclassified Curtobacterium]WIB58824.1 YlxR family protein [Curtobacterium sp. MCLR17_007]
MVAVRTCIGSRRRAPRSSLLRVVAQGDGRVVADPKAVMPGRGAWLTPTVEAYELAVKRRAFRRALRLDREPDTSAVLEYLRRLPEAEPRLAEQIDAEEHQDTTEQAERLMDN